jgi:hypothetical protein
MLVLKLPTKANKLTKAKIVPEVATIFAQKYDHLKASIHNVDVSRGNLLDIAEMTAVTPMSSRRVSTGSGERKGQSITVTFEDANGLFSLSEIITYND